MAATLAESATGALPVTRDQEARMLEDAREVQLDTDGQRGAAVPSQTHGAAEDAREGDGGCDEDDWSEEDEDIIGSMEWVDFREGA
jgi:hypothetical protein